jgi:uncharacterized membrane protein
MDIFKNLLYVHIFCGTISLALGLFVMITKKGNARHRLIGTVYFYSMLIAALVSFPMSYLHSDYFLFIVGVFTTYMLLSGKRYLKNKGISDVKPIDWLLTFVMLFFGIAFIVFGIHKLINNNSFGTVLIVFGGISCLFVWRDKNNFEGKSRYRNYGLVAHIERMVASYIATVTAFLVVNNKVLPDIAAWLLPTLLLVPLLVKWVRKYKIKAVDRQQNGTQHSIAASGGGRT